MVRSSRVVVPSLLVTAGALGVLAACQVNGKDPAAVTPSAPTSTATAAPTPVLASATAAPTATAVATSVPVAEPLKLPCDGPVAGMACIPAGDFIRGSKSGEKNEQPQSTIYVDAFFMDLTEVTNEMHNACVAAKKCKVVHTVYPDFDRPRQPKVGVRWYDAVDFCKAAGKHLPTEAEWEKAARGPDGRLYPWGDEPATCERAVIMDERGRSCGVPQKSSEPDKGRTFEVGTRPPNPYGLYDMSGNAWEWTNDYYSESWAACGEACQGKNPKGPCGGVSPCDKHEDRAVRGGSWFWKAPLASATYRRHHVPSNNPYHHYGFRCAASLEEAAALRDGKTAVPWGTPTPPSTPPAGPAAKPFVSGGGAAVIPSDAVKTTATSAAAPTGTVAPASTK